MNKDKEQDLLELVQRVYYEMVRRAITDLVDKGEPFDHHKIVDMVNEEEARLIKNN